MGRFYSFWLYPALAAVLFSTAAAGRSSPPWTSLLWLVPLGLPAWTLIEYLLHRFLFHWRPRHPRLKEWLAEMHLSHHGPPLRLLKSVATTVMVFSPEKSVTSRLYDASLGVFPVDSRPTK